MGMPHHVSGSNFPVLSVNLIPVLLSLTCLFMLLPHFLTISTHHFDHPLLPLSFTPATQDLPHSQTFPTIDSLPAPQLTPRFILSTSFFLVFYYSFFRLVPCRRLSWLFVSFWAHANIGLVHRIISYNV